MQRQAPVSEDGRADTLITMIELNGFVASESITKLLRSAHRATGFREMLRGAGIREFTISSGHGDRALHIYSSMDIFGRNVSETYFVVDFDRFRESMSARLEAQFRAMHPNPGRDMKAAYSRFMHKNMLNGFRD